MEEWKIKKKLLIETIIVTYSEDVINNTLDFLSVDVDECVTTSSRIIRLHKCPSCEKEVIQEGYNYCPICSQKISWY